MDTSNKNFEDYMDDIVRIKTLLEKNEEVPIIEMWAFLLWGFLVLSGTWISSYLAVLGSLSGASLSLIVWLPIVCIGIAGEAAAFVRRSAKVSIPVINRRYLRFMAAFSGAIIPMLFLLFRISGSSQPLAGVILLTASAPLFLYGLVSYSSFFFEAILLMAAGFVVFTMEQAGLRVSPVISGYLTGLVYLTAGIHGMTKERRDHE